MISENLREKNKLKFAEINLKYGIFTKELEDFLGDDFYQAPASPLLDMYGCYPGGLLNHSLKVSKYAVQLNNLLPENIRLDMGCVIKVSMLSQIGKTFLFAPNKSEWHVKNQGKMYQYCDDELVDLNIGERSAYYAINYGVKLTEEEYQAIVNSDKEKTIKWEKKLLTHILRLGFEMAVLEEKHGKKQN